MMPLALASIGDANTIKKIGGSPEVKKHLENLGFVSRRRRHYYYNAGRKRNCESKGIPSCDQRGNGAQNHGLIFTYCAINFEGGKGQ